MSQDLEERELDLITHFTSKFKVLEDLAAELNEVEGINNLLFKNKFKLIVLLKNFDMF